jgi:hypothetical protein
MIIGFDFESWLIAPARQLPPGVCMSWCEATQTAAGLAVGRSGVVTAEEGCDYLQRWLDAGAHIVGANTAFDVLVSVVTVATRGGDWMKLLRSWVDAYEGGRVHDVFVRQKLLDIAAGCYRFEERPNGGKPLHHQYNLAGIVKRHTGRVLSKPENEDDHDHWRLRFSELEGVPIAQYPKAAYDYALEDAIAAIECFVGQDIKRTTDKRIQRNFPGRDPFVDEARQTCSCLPLKAMSAYGLRTDGPAVERLVEQVQEKIIEERAVLVDAGLVRPPAYSRNTEAILRYVRERGHTSHFQDAQLPLTPEQPEPPIRLCKAEYLAAFQATQDVQYWRLGNYLAITKDIPAYRVHVDGLVEAGLVDIEHSRDTKAAARRCADAYEAEGLAIPRTEGYDPKPVAEGGKGHGKYDGVSLDADACSGSGDPMLDMYSSYSSLAKTLANDIPMLRGGVFLPVHTRFEELMQTGRTSSSKPNVQNVRRLPGIRECFKPRDGFVYVDTDFAMLELHTLAQVCFWMLGFSTLGEALRAGKDPHLMIAANILALDYAVALARKDANDSEVDNARTGGKGLNFGAAGGLSAATFVVYAWTNYKIRLTLEQSQKLLAIYHSTWVEIPTYFKWVKGHKDPYSIKIVKDPKTGLPRETCLYNLVQPWSLRLRAGIGYCNACNSPFQGLGADVAKMALWLVWKASVGLSELGEADPLFGCFPVNFVHDSIMTEVPEARAHEAAYRQKELMELAGRMVLVDVPVKADMVVTRRWSKKAGQWRQPCTACGSPTKCKCEGVAKWADRRLIPWDLRIACRRELDAFEAKPDADRAETLAKLRAGEKWKTAEADERAALIAAAASTPRRAAAFEYLKLKQWPRDAARDTAAAVYGDEQVAGKVAA